MPTDSPSTFSGTIDLLIGLITDILAIFMQPPALWFVTLALVGSAAAVTRRFVPMKKR